MAATAASDATDGPVFSLINKRLRGLRKKLNRILQIEESVAQGKPIIKEQEDLINSKPSISAAIDELEKLRQPLAAAIAEEIILAVQSHQVSASPSVAATEPDHAKDEDTAKEEKAANTELQPEREHAVVEDLLNLLYFGAMFDVKSQNDFTSTMLTRTHERGCCLTYDYVTDDEAADLLAEKDLDFISTLSGLLISRPVDSSLSHKNALRRCIEHAKLWLTNSDQLIDSFTSVTYAGLRAKLNKIMASDFFTTTPEMKATVEMAAAAAGNYASFQVPVHGSMVPMTVPDQVDCQDEQYQEEDDTSNFQGNETYNNQSSPVAEPHKVEYKTEDPAEVLLPTELIKPQAEAGQNQRDVESKEHNYVQRRSYQHQRGSRGGGGGGGGRRGYPNGHGGRGSSRGGGDYQNGRNQFYDQPGGYYPRNYYNNRPRGSRGTGASYSNHGVGVQASHVPADS